MFTKNVEYVKFDSKYCKLPPASMREQKDRYKDHKKSIV